MAIVLGAGVVASMVVDAPIASAASDLYVATTGTDASNNCLVQASPSATISHANSVADGGATILVGTGTYDENVIVNVPDLTITGQGASTVITGPAPQPTLALNGDFDSVTKMSISSNAQSSGLDITGDDVTITDDTVARNGTTPPDQAGISNTGDSVVLRGDAIWGNGAGIINQGNTITIDNDTVASNEDSGITNSGTDAVVTNDTIVGNRGGPEPIAAGITENLSGSLTLGATILANNIGQGQSITNCGGTGPITDAGYNIDVEGDTCGFSIAEHDVFGTQPSSSFLGSLTWNGGPTSTIPIATGSIAQGAIPSSSTFCNGQDQRGAPRLQPGSTACDIGAFQSIGGYWEVAADGGIFAFNAPFYGSMGGQHLNAPIVGMATDPLTGGYWEVAADGGIFSFNAAYDGSIGGQHLNAPVVGMAADPGSGGYWEVASDGGVFNFGGAGFSGPTSPQHLSAPVVGMAAFPLTGGYWEVAADGGIFSFNATYDGSIGGQHLNAPVVGMAATLNGQGYWEVASDGGIFSFGVPFRGSMGGTYLNAPIVGMATG